MNFLLLESPYGTLLLVSDGFALKQLSFIEDLSTFQPNASWHKRKDDLLAACQTQLEEWFTGQRQTFDLPLAPEGTAFQQKVWKALQNIPYGTTCSYGNLAQAMSKPTAFRAVGSANGKNPIAIIIPCHRVVAAKGGLGGYAYGIELKQQLLALEAQHLHQNAYQLA